MEILSYEPSLLDDVTAVYNEMVTGTPYCYPVTPEQFATVVPTDGNPVHGQFRSEHLLVARDGSDVLGFIQYGIWQAEWVEEGDPPLGAIRFLCQRPGHRPAGQALHDAAENWLREQGAATVKTFHQDTRFPFQHLSCSYLSDRLGHIIALLGANGHERSNGEVYLEWDNFPAIDPGPPPPGLDFEVEWGSKEDARPELTLLLSKDGQNAGVCNVVTCGDPWQPPEAATWSMTRWLGVDEPFQKQGWARYLLARARFEIHGKGCRRAIISTNWQNWRAMQFYSNYGYRVTDWTYGFTKELKGEALD